jgi:nicotinate-nucleotide pyrophosphorylase
MTLAMMREAFAFNLVSAKLNLRHVTLETVRQFAETGGLISTGALTHSVTVFDSASIG